jgi:hypothetical protein
MVFHSSSFKMEFASRLPCLGIHPPHRLLIRLTSCKAEAPARMAIKANSQTHDETDPDEQITKLRCEITLRCAQ